MSSCCRALPCSLQTEFLASSVVPRNSNASGLAKKGLAAAVPFCLTCHRGRGSPPLQQQIPSVPLPGFSGVGASCAGSIYEQVADWRSVGEPLIKKNPPDCIVCLPLSTLMREILSASEVKHSLLLLLSHSFDEARTLSSCSSWWPALSCSFPKGGSTLCCPLWSFSSPNFRFFAQKSTDLTS